MWRIFRKSKYASAPFSTVRSHTYKPRFRQCRAVESDVRTQVSLCPDKEFRDAPVPDMLSEQTRNKDCWLSTQSADASESAHCPFDNPLGPLQGKRTTPPTMERIMIHQESNVYACRELRAQEGTTGRKVHVAPSRRKRRLEPDGDATKRLRANKTGTKRRNGCTSLRLATARIVVRIWIERPGWTYCKTLPKMAKI